MLVSGVRSSCETFETKSVLRSESRRSRRAARSRTNPPATKATSSSPSRTPFVQNARREVASGSADRTRTRHRGKSGPSAASPARPSSAAGRREGIRTAPSSPNSSATNAVRASGRTGGRAVPRSASHATVSNSTPATAPSPRRTQPRRASRPSTGHGRTPRSGSPASGAPHGSAPERRASQRARKASSSAVASRAGATRWRSQPAGRKISPAGTPSRDGRTNPSRGRHRKTLRTKPSVSARRRRTKTVSAPPSAEAMRTRRPSRIPRISASVSAAVRAACSESRSARSRRSSSAWRAMSAAPRTASRTAGSAMQSR